MKETKFRVWDNKENKYFKPIYEAYKGNLLDLSVSLSGELIRRTLEIPSEHESRFPNKYILEQFTGLKDKNGKEIYEGDIVKYDDGDNWETGRQEVKFINGAFNCACFHSDNKEFINEDRIIEVIGNIHENPELLSQK